MEEAMSSLLLSKYGTRRETLTGRVIKAMTRHLLLEWLDLIHSVLRSHKP
jgi:hypothetical protein